MSSPLAGKFQDHYEVLGIDPRSAGAVVQDTYSKLARKAKESGDAERLESLNLAYEVLGDPMLRREFDKLKGLGEEVGGPKFSGARFFDTLGRDQRLRVALLCLLYDRRRNKPFTPSLSVRFIEGMIAASSEEIVLALWYLKARNLAANDDKSSVLITVDGIDYLEREKPDASVVLPFIKPEALAGQPGATAEVPGVSPVKEVVPIEVLEEALEPVLAGAASDPLSSLSILRRVLSRA